MIKNIIREHIEKCRHQLDRIDNIVLYNQNKVLQSFKSNKVAARHFVGTDGYGYDDVGRDTLAKLFAGVFGCEAALVSPLICSGTHAITIALFGLVATGQRILSITGKPYDTLDGVIDGNSGSLRSFGVDFHQIDLLDNGEFDRLAISATIRQLNPSVIYLQKSRGYSLRPSLTSKQIGDICRFVRECDSDACIVVDNCYGEFVEMQEPTELGADICIGSLIKNIGGGLAPTGGYIVGGQQYIDKIANRLTAPSVGAEIGSYAYGYRQFYQGLFMAPHIVGEAMKSIVLFSSVLNSLGYITNPVASDNLADIVCTIKFEDRNKLIEFCQSIQSESPVDSHVTPQPWAMPGYSDDIIMSAGCFVQGSSIELSCDAPIRPPYVAYLQGALTFQHGILALNSALDKLLK